MTGTEVRTDEGAREAVVRDLHRTLFLEAGAGSGKTKCLVDRFVALVEDGVPADRIAAITFTEKAATELTDRIRGRLEECARAGSEACTAALAVLDRAAIGTLHAFAQRILNEHPIEAGLPPRITVLDEIASQVGFDARWEAWVDQLLDDPAMERPIRVLLAAGAGLAHLKDVAEAFDDNWDLVAERVDRAPRTIPPVDIDDLLSEIDDVAALAGCCPDAGDKLRQHLEDVVAAVARDLRAAADEDTQLRILGEARFRFTYGQVKNWRRPTKDEVVGRLDALAASAWEVRGRVQEAVLQTLASAVARFTVAGAEERRRAGELEFHDLLVLARAVLRDPQHGWAVRQALAARYQRLLLDEFQDTDPIQVELAVLIASDDPAAAGQPWEQVATRPGALFFVGDPKQSIYRFRRADIAMFLRAKDHLVGGSEALTRNFRTVRPVVDWVNATFSTVIVEEEDSQPAYLPLDAHRTEAPPTGPPVAFFGTDHGTGPGTGADALREAEADDVVAVVTRAMRQAWSVGEGDGWRAPQWRDMAVLLPARTSLPFLEAALERAQVPYRAETSSLVYGTREVRDLLMIARAVEDPTDELAVVAALRTPAFACGDDDLYTWKVRHHGRWDHQGEVPDEAPSDHPVARGLAWLGELHRERLWLSPSAVLDRIVRDRRLLELAVVERRPRDLWRRLRFVLDQCRAWEEAGGGTLRDYLRWAAGQSAEGARVVETVLPESDDDAVRILTIHGAKGLEFPIVVLSGLTTELRSWNRGVQVRFPADGAWAVKLRKGVSTADFDRTQPVDEQMDHNERLRLLYVAATRARDHLVVSTHRNGRKRQHPTSAEVFVRHGSHDDLVEHLTFDGQPAPVASQLQLPSPAPLPTLEQWRADHEAALARGLRRIATSATRLAEEAAAAREDGLQKDARDLDLPPWQKGRYGSAIGRAVHAVLQTVDLATGEGLEAAAKAQAAAEGVLGREGVIERLARSALDADIVRRAAGLAHWREVYVGVPYGDGVLEGYIDLLYRDDDGLVVVDHKTDAWRSDADLDAKVERYALQLQAYAHAVAEATGEKVARTLLLFTAESTAAVVREVPSAEGDWP
jgi:ATP-dependent helicase/nuclease subunit A